MISTSRSIAGRVSTRDTIESHIIQVLEVEPRDIVSDRHKGEDIQQIRAGSRVNRCSFVYMIAAIELRREQEDLFTLDDYVVLMNDLVAKISGCTTYLISFENHWVTIANRIRSLVAIYNPDTKTFAYCHWWNSLTKRFQGLVKEGVAEKSVPSLLANLSFNDRIIHYFIVRSSDNTYEIPEHLKYCRVPGCTGLTFVPGPSNSLFRRVDKIVNSTVLELPVMGFRMVNNIALGWSPGYYRDNAIIDGVQMEAVTDTNPAEQDHGVLQHVDTVNMPIYRPDYDVLEIGKVYNITLDQLVRSRINAGRPIPIQVDRPRKTRGVRDLVCILAE
ncbi:hypothetical protein VTP01DRAFT_965 [Rhizomucor pusillus]|uniref:uncharacterized protein n=1 Tax=Rhizomucor pusillus TaxID=4840 RepID=UPI0037429F04